jgi:hypothetical protein
MAHSEEPSEGTMQSQNVATVRRAYEAYARGDLPTMLGFIDPELEWTYLDPAVDDPEPQVCLGRQELQVALQRQGERGLVSELETSSPTGTELLSWCEPQASARTGLGRPTIATTTSSRCVTDGSSRSMRVATGKKR